MTVQKVNQDKNEETHKMNDNEWIQANLNLICENNGNKIMFINRRGGRANKKDRVDLNILMSNNNLANIGDMKSFLLPKGRMVCEKFNGNWLDYLKNRNEKEKKEEIIKNIDNQNKIIELIKNYKWIILTIISIVLLLIAIL